MGAMNRRHFLKLALFAPAAMLLPAAPKKSLNFQDYIRDAKQRIAAGIGIDGRFLPFPEGLYSRFEVFKSRQAAFDWARAKTRLAVDTRRGTG